MKKALIFALALALAGGVAYANFCARDYVPAATLLVPYAAVEMDSTGLVPAAVGGTTLLWVTNVSSERQLIHISVWNAYSSPVVDFDEILSGYDVWRIDFKDMLTGHFDYFDTEGVNGFWAPPSSKPTGSSTNLGLVAQPFGPSSNCVQPTLPAPQDTDYPADLDAASGCAFPYGYHPEYGSGIVRRLRGAIYTNDYQLNVCSTPASLVSNPPWLDAITRNPLFFYVTVDAVDACSRDFPNSSGYWLNHVTPDEDNVLIGDIIYINYATNQSDSIPAVHIEYDADNPQGGPYFYSLMGYPTGGVDFLEPLATAFAFRYMNAGGVSTDLVVWKTTFDEIYIYSLQTYFWWASDPYVYFAWDMNENSKTRGVGPSGFDTPEPNVIPFETQKVPLNTANWTGLMAGDGWMLLVFAPSIPFANDEYFYYMQAWAGVAYTLVNPQTGVTFSTMTEAATMANAWCFPTQTLARQPMLSINYDYDGNWFMQ